jgi:uncharacterized membrane protein YkoI
MRPLRLLTILLGLIWASAASAADACFSDWSAASIMVKTEGLVTLDQLTKLAPAKLGGEIVRSSLCEARTGFVYKLVVRTKDGQMRSISVDAKHPFDD